MSNSLLTIQVHHTPQCGTPPAISSDSGNCYIGYFENPYGEQWIFAMDRDTGRALLRGGDIEWDTEIEIVDGQAGDLMLGEHERLWLRACWLAARQQTSRPHG